MTKLLVKKKDGSVHIREKSTESGARPERVHPIKLLTWAALATAANESKGDSMTEVNKAIIKAMSNKNFKPQKERVQVTPEVYNSLLIQAAKKGIPKKTVDKLVMVVEAESEEDEQEKRINTFIKLLFQNDIPLVAAVARK